LAVVTAAIVARIAFGLRAPAFVTNDSHSYLLPGWELIHGLGFDPIYKRPPLYPAFVGAAMALAGEEPRALAMLQHALGVVTTGLAYWIALTLGGRVAATVAGLLTGLSGALLITERYVMSETLFGFLLTGSLALWLALARRPTARFAVVCGVALGLATLCRPIGQLVLAMLAVGLIWIVGPRQALRPVLAMVVAFAIVVVPWMARNWAVHGAFTIAGGLGEGLAVRTIRYDQQFEFRDPPGGNADRQLTRARRIYRDEAKDDSAFELAKKLREGLGVSEARADDLMRHIALEGIAARPFYFVQTSADMWLKTLVGRPIRLRQDWVPWRNIAWDERVAHLLPLATPAEDREFREAELIVSVVDPARLAPILLPLAALGMLAAAKAGRRPVVVIGALVLVLLAFGAAVIGIEWRYRYPLDPAIHVLAGCGAAVLIDRMRRVRRPIA
jgi:4-amino-4-deoxy-L-arabinose transferase-like glycosyltransferase